MTAPRTVVRFTVKQAGVLKGIVAGAAITVVVIGAVIFAGPTLLPPDAAAADRMGFALKADVFLALWLAISIGLLARHRFFSPDDIDGGGLTQGTGTANILQASLQNTLEQTVVAVLVHLAWAVLMPASWIAAIPAAVFLFLCGRMLFLRGYRGGAPSRALGFALTFYPSVLMLILVAAAALWQGFF
jgi:MAPEG family